VADVPKRWLLASLTAASVLASGWFKPPCACRLAADKHLTGEALRAVGSQDHTAAASHACCGGNGRKSSSGSDRPGPAGRPGGYAATLNRNCPPGSDGPVRPVSFPGCCPGGCPRDCTSPCSLGKPVVAPASTPETLVGQAAFSGVIGDDQSGAPPSPALDSVFHPPRG